MKNVTQRLLNSGLSLTGWLLLTHLLVLASPVGLVRGQDVADPPEAKVEEKADDQAEEKVEDQSKDQAKDPVAGDSQDAPKAVGPKIIYENSVETRWKIGTKIVTGSGRATDVLITFPVPSNWPEQSVTIIEREIPVEIGNVNSRKLSAGVQQVVVQFPAVPANDAVEISYTLDIVNRVMEAPEETQAFVFPKHTSRDVKPFLVASKHVNHKSSKLRKKAKEIIADHEFAWDQTEAIYDWVRENIQIQETRFHSAQHTLKNLSGTNEDKTFLFVALCRSAKIPSRIVFAKGSSYAEFMLAGPDGKELHWFPCDVSGVREFGGLSEPRLILQKGDGFKVPEEKYAQKYVAEHVSCKGTVRPRVGFFRAEIFEDEQQE